MNATENTQPKDFAERINSAESYTRGEMKDRDAAVARFRATIANESRSLRSAAEWDELDEAAVDEALARECRAVLEMMERVYEQEPSTEAAYNKIVEILDHDIKRDVCRVVSNASIKRPDMQSLRVTAKTAQLLNDVRMHLGANPISTL